MAGFISDIDALARAEKFFSPDRYAAFAYDLEMMRHLEDCIVTSTPSPHCELRGLDENLNWCHVGLKIHEASFGDNLQMVLDCEKCRRPLCDCSCRQTICCVCLGPLSAEETESGRNMCSQCYCDCRGSVDPATRRGFRAPKKEEN
jgi:hypothetical protein